MATRFGTRAGMALAITLLAGCGGGGDPVPDGTARIASRVDGADRTPPDKQRLAAPITVDARALFDWAQYRYPELFPYGPQNFPLTHDGVSYTVRAYPNGNYLGLTAQGSVYGLGPEFTSGQLQGFGHIADYAGQVQADACNMYPGTCEPPVTSAANECFDPAWMRLIPGQRSRIVYETTAPGLTGDMTVDAQIVGPSTFDGKPAIKTLFHTVANQNYMGGSIHFTSKLETYEQLDASGFLLILGDTDESEILVPGEPSSETISKTVHSPPFLNREVGLGLGQSVTNTTTVLTTSVPDDGFPSREPYAVTHTFEARQAIDVLGRQHQTCRYREVEDGVDEVTTIWYLVGKGPIAVQIEIRSASEVVTLRMRSGTYNGVPI